MWYSPRFASRRKLCIQAKSRSTLQRLLKRRGWRWFLGFCLSGGGSGGDHLNAIFVLEPPVKLVRVVRLVPDQSSGILIEKNSGKNFLNKRRFRMVQVQFGASCPRQLHSRCSPVETTEGILNCSTLCVVGFRPRWLDLPSSPQPGKHKKFPATEAGVRYQLIGAWVVSHSGLNLTYRSLPNVFSRESYCTDHQHHCSSKHPEGSMSFAMHKRLRQTLHVIRKEWYTSSHIAVLECLAYRIDDRTHPCFPSVQTIADESYLSEPHARKVLSELGDDGVVEIIHVNRKARYKLNFPAANSMGCTGDTEDGREAGRGDDQALIDPSDALQRKTGAEAEVALERRNGRAVADPDVLKFHALLMKKIESTIPVPTATDVKLLTEAIRVYGLAELYQILEGIYRQKNEYWRNKLNAATHPCSMLCRSLGTISKQLNETEENAIRWSRNRS